MITFPLLRTVLLSLLLACVALPLAAQKNPLTYKRDKIGNFNLGFLMGMSYNRYYMEDRGITTDRGDTLYGVVLKGQPGLTLGMIANYNVADFLSVRVVPHFTFEQRSIYYYSAKNPQPQVRAIESSYFNLPLMAQWRTTYYKHYRIYTLTGAQIGFNLIGSKRVQDDPLLLKIKTQDVALVIGTGIILYGDRIKLSPEIRYSAGLTNIYVPQNTFHGNAISKLFSQVLTLNVNFE
jgi:hypothetical protein